MNIDMSYLRTSVEELLFYFPRVGFVRGPSCRLRTTGSRCQRLFFVASSLNSSLIVKNSQELSCFQTCAQSCDEVVVFRATRFAVATLRRLCE